MAESFFSHLLKGARIVIGDDVEVKAVGSKIGQRIGGGLRSAPAGMAFVDVTGRVDADADGIVFEGLPLERPIIPKFLVPKALAGKLSRLVEGDSMEIEKQRRAGNTNIEFNEDKFNNLVASLEKENTSTSGMRSAGEGGKWNGGTPELRDIKPGADLSGANFYDANLEGASLSGANLEDADLRGALLNGADLRGANLRYAELGGAFLRGVDFRGADMHRSNMAEAMMTGSNLQGVDLSRAGLEGADLEGANLTDANLTGAKLYGANLEGAKMPEGWKPGDNGTLGNGGMSSRSSDEYPSLENRLDQYSFTPYDEEPRRRAAAAPPAPPAPPDPPDDPSDGMRSVGKGGKWNGKKPEPEDIKPGADLSGADLPLARLGGRDLTDANLTGANLYAAMMSDANLTNANLTNANLWGADLTNANLTNADLSGARLHLATLRGANLNGAKMPVYWKPGDNGTLGNGGMSSRTSGEKPKTFREMMTEVERLQAEGKPISSLFVADWTQTRDGIEMDAPDIDGLYEIQGNNREGFVVTRYSDAVRNGGQNQQEYEHDRIFKSRAAAKKWAERNYEMASGGMSSRTMREQDPGAYDFVNELIEQGMSDQEIYDSLEASRTSGMREITLSKIGQIRSGGKKLTQDSDKRGFVRKKNTRKINDRFNGQQVARLSASRGGRYGERADIEEGLSDVQEIASGVSSRSGSIDWNKPEADWGDGQGGMVTSWDIPGGGGYTILDYEGESSRRFKPSALVRGPDRKVILRREFPSRNEAMDFLKDYHEGLASSDSGMSSRGMTSFTKWEGRTPKKKDLVPGADLSGADLTRADLNGLDLRGAYLYGANLQFAQLKDTDLSGANLYGANLRGANLRGANLQGTKVRNANLLKANLTDANLRGASLGFSNLGGANLTNANLIGADLTGADLTSANLTGADLRKTNLTRSNLTNAKMPSATGPGSAIFNRAKLENVDLREVDLSTADLRASNLTNADLRGVDLRGARLSGANVRGADFTDAQLPDLSKTVMSGADTARGMSSRKDMLGNLDIPKRDRRKLDDFINELYRDINLETSSYEYQESIQRAAEMLVQGVEKKGIAFLDRYIKKSEEARKIQDLIDDGMSDDAIIRITGATDGAIRRVKRWGAVSPAKTYLAFARGNAERDLYNKGVVQKGGLNPQDAAKQIQNNAVWDLIEAGVSDEEIIEEMRRQADDASKTGISKFPFNETKLEEIRKKGRVKLEVGQKGTNTFAVSLERMDEDNKNRGIAGDDDISPDELGEALAPDDILFGSGVEAAGAESVAGAEDEAFSRLQAARFAGAEDEGFSRLQVENRAKSRTFKKVRDALPDSFKILEVSTGRRSDDRRRDDVEIRVVAEELGLTEAIVGKHLRLMDEIKKRIEDGSFADPEWIIPFDEIAEVGKTKEGVRKLAEKYNFPNDLMSLMARQVSGFHKRLDTKIPGIDKQYQDFGDEVSRLIKAGYNRGDIAKMIDGVISLQALQARIDATVKKGLLDKELMSSEVLNAIQAIRKNGIDAVSAGMVEKLRSLGVGVDNLVPVTARRVGKVTPEEIEFQSLRDGGKSRQEVMELMNISKEQYLSLYGRIKMREKNQ